MISPLSGKARYNVRINQEITTQVVGVNNLYAFFQECFACPSARQFAVTKRGTPEHELWNKVQSSDE